jgi:hypothetical protein
VIPPLAGVLEAEVDLEAIGEGKVDESERGTNRRTAGCKLRKNNAYLSINNKSVPEACELLRSAWHTSALGKECNRSIFL